MKKFIPLLIIAIALFSCNTGTKNALYEDLMLPETTGVFRGIDFNMSKSEVKAIETARKTITIYEDESENKLIVTTDMGPDKLNFGDITYDFDGKGLYGISVETYAKTLEDATAVFDLAVKEYTSKYGAPIVAEDGFTEFEAELNGSKFSIAIKNITDFDESFGMYMYFDVIE